MTVTTRAAFAEIASPNGSINRRLRVSGGSGGGCSSRPRRESPRPRIGLLWAELELPDDGEERSGHPPAARRARRPVAGHEPSLASSRLRRASPRERPPSLRSLPGRPSPRAPGPRQDPRGPRHLFPGPGTAAEVLGRTSRRPREPECGSGTPNSQTQRHSLRCREASGGPRSLRRGPGTFASGPGRVSEGSETSFRGARHDGSGPGSSVPGPRTDFPGTRHSAPCSRKDDSCPRQGPTVPGGPVPSCGSVLVSAHSIP